MKRTRPTAGVAAIAALVCLWGGVADAGAARFDTKRIGVFNEPVYVDSPRKGQRLFVVERRGVIRVLRRGKLVKRPFLDISKQVNTTYQRGLFSIAFAPGYSRNGRFYVIYVTRDDTVQVDEFRRARGKPNRANHRSQRHVLNVGEAWIFHHGGQLEFGPDGKLYMSTGVANSPPRAQELTRLHGKILRIDPRRRGEQPYTVPRDNPFVDQGAARPEVWASGLRNPWRFSFNRRNGGMAIGDVGEDTAEEIDYIPRGRRGANFGFPRFEGNQPLYSGSMPQRYVPPVIEHLHRGTPNPFCAVIGGYFVRDRRLRGLYGRYLYADMCSSQYRTVKLGKRGARQNRRHDIPVPGPISFGEDNRGRIYVMGQDGPVYRIVPARKQR